MNNQASSSTQALYVAPRVAEADPRFSRIYRGLLASVGIVALLLTSAPAQAVATAPPLLTAQNFAVLGDSTVTNTGSTTLNGDLGLHPGTSITGLGSITLNGVVHQTDAVAQQAQVDATAANTNLAGQACDFAVSADLGGQTLVPGVYCSASSMALSGILTLDAQNDPNAVWVFKMGSTLTVADASGAEVVMVNGGSPCNVFWRVGSSATLGTSSKVAGTIIADQSITLKTGAILSGSALALNAAVTLDTNAVTICSLMPTVTVTKVSIGGTGAFDFTGDNGFAPQTITTAVAGTPVSGSTQTLTVAGAATTITEAVPPAGFTLASIACTGLGAGGTATPDIANRTVTLNAAATTAGAAILCTFTNSTATPDSITIIKNAIGGDNTFAFTETGLGGGSFNITTISGSNNTQFTGLAPGSYTVNETPVPTGWSLTDLQCSGATTPAVITGGQAVITLAAGDAVVCTYTNTAQSSITINKTALGGNGTFSYTGTTGIGAFNITTTNGSGSASFTPLAAGSYIINETPMPADWSLTSLLCSGTATPVEIIGGQAVIALAAGEDAVCNYTNTKLPPTPIPTLSEWAMIMLAAFLAIAGFAAMRRQAK